MTNRVKMTHTDASMVLSNWCCPEGDFYSVVCPHEVISDRNTRERFLKLIVPKKKMWHEWPEDWYSVKKAAACIEVIDD